MSVEKPGSAESQSAAARIVESLEAIAELMGREEKELGRIDSVAGDGDHGIGMVRGAQAAVYEAQRLRDEGGGAATVLAGAGDAWSAAAGGTSGALWGALLTAFGTVLGDEKKVEGSTLKAAARAALDAVVRLGGAQPGDKTMVDAATPAVEKLEAGGSWQDAAEAARSGAEGTADMVARVGRARPLGEKSLGTADAGATSLAHIIAALAERLK